MTASRRMLTLAGIKTRQHRPSVPRVVIDFEVVPTSGACRARHLPCHACNLLRLREDALHLPCVPFAMRGVPLAVPPRHPPVRPHLYTVRVLLGFVRFLRVAPLHVHLPLIRFSGDHRRGR
jgi:hypothetical protein